jgi:hypothetical protein
VGELRLRYCITHELVYKFQNNFYGTAIIQNARILGKDALNRCLIDRPSYDWFMQQLNGIENLSSVTLHQIKVLPQFAEYDTTPISQGKNIVIPTELMSSIDWIKAADVMSVGTVKSKESEIDVYNVHLQVSVTQEQVEVAGGNPSFTITLGNLNAQGLT